MNRRDVIAASAIGLSLSACVGSKQPKRNNEQIVSALSGFAVNVESWWADLSFDTRFDMAAKSGFEHVEFWFIDSWNRDVKALARHASDAGVKISQIVADAPALADLKNKDAYLESVKRAIDNAHTLDTKIVTVTGHQDIDGIAAVDALKAYQDNIAASAPLWEAANIYCAIEPFNPYDHPGHFIYGHADALSICQQINSPFVKLNWDLFHMQRYEGNLITHFEKGADHVAYVQLADSPARHQPGTGEVNYQPVLEAVRTQGYKDPIGLELWAKDKDYARALEAVIRLGEAISM